MASTAAAEETKASVDAGEIEEEIIVDEYVNSFESIDASDVLQQAQKIADYQLLLKNERIDDKAVKVKEQCIYRLAKLFTEAQRIEDVMDLVKSNGDFFSVIPKAKTAKIVRSVLNIVATIPDSLEIQVRLCKDVVDWCIAEKRTFLRQRIESKLCSLLQQQKKPVEALALIDKLLPELKKLDDKQMLTEAHLTEARIYHSLSNIPKSKASLTASRSAANSIYVAPLLQAEIDEMSGMLHCEEADYLTAYSYFLEAFDAYDQASVASSSVSCLKYMVLCKVLNNASEEVASILSGKMGLKHSGVDLEAMAAIAKAAKVRSLDDFKAVVSKYESYLKHDDLISHHLDMLYDNMLEANLLKIINPYSSVEISHVAALINLPEQQVVHKLSQMILDRKFYGILDQGKGHLIVYESSSEDQNFTRSVDIIGSMESVVETLFTRAKTLAKVQSTVATTAATAATSSTAAAAAAKAGGSAESKDKSK